jgi:hypothetical protein
VIDFVSVSPLFFPACNSKKEEKFSIVSSKEKHRFKKTKTILKALKGSVGKLFIEFG